MGFDSLAPTTTINRYKVKTGLRIGQETASCRQTAAGIEEQLEELRIFVKLIFIIPFLLLRHIQFQQPFHCTLSNLELRAQLLTVPFRRPEDF